MLVPVRGTHSQAFAGGYFSAGAMGGRMLGSTTASVYVGNLSWEVQWQDLKDHMRGPNQDLNVIHADVMVDATGPASLSVRAIATPSMRFALRLIPTALCQS